MSEAEHAVINALIPKETHEYYALRQMLIYYLNVESANKFCGRFEPLSNKGNRSLLTDKMLQKLLKKIRKEKNLSSQPVAALVAASSYQESTPHFELLFSAYLQIIFILQRDFSEHHKKIEHLCRFLRLSITKKRDKRLMTYLKQVHKKGGSIKSVIIELSELLDSTSNKTNKNESSLSKTELNKLEQILFAYRVVDEGLHKVNRKKKKKHKTHFLTQTGDTGDSEDDRADIHKELMHVEMAYSQSSSSLQPEELAEERSAEILDNRFQPLEGTTQSAAQQFLKLQKANQHIKNNQLNFSTNYRKIAAVDYLSIFDSIWRQFHTDSNAKYRIYFAALIMMMLTGRHLDVICKDIAKPTSQRELIKFYGENKSRVGFLTKVDLKVAKNELTDYMQSQAIVTELNKWCKPT